MAINIRGVFKTYSGRDIRFLKAATATRGDMPVVIIWFRRGKRTFQLDGVIHQGATPDDQLRNAVIRIAGIAKNLTAVLEKPDGTGEIKVERTLS